MRANSEPILTVECLLREGAALRALGRRLLDDAAADDLVQDTYVAALRGRAPQGAIGAWLGGIARRLALLQRRGEARRRAREVLAAQEAVAPAAVDAAATTECTQRIATALRELPETYRTAIVLRFWHDLPPRRIAARLGVPVNTVHSRLQRGLVLLRERLDTNRGSRAAWAGPLAAWLRVPGGSAAAAGVSAGLLLGVTGMGMKGNVVAAVGLVAMGSWIVSTLASPASAPDADGGEGVVAAQGSRTDDLGGGAENTRLAAIGDRTTVTGRCVDAIGNVPLANCRVALVSDRVASEGQHREPQVLVTDAGGRFTFAPVPAAYAHRLFVVGGDHLVAVECALPKLPAGTHDVGDVRLEGGARLVGTVHDAAGKGVGGVVLDIELAPTVQAGKENAFTPCKQLLVYSRADGVLLQEGGAIAAGDWQVSVRTPEHLLRSPAQFVVAPGQQQVELDVVVALLAERPSITGLVVDESGAAVAGLTLRASDGSTGKSGPDGAFALHRRSENDAVVRLAVASHETSTVCTPDTEYTWGSKDHRVVVRQAVGVWLQVARADNGEPVTDYGVWLIPLEKGQWSRGLQDAGRHEQGRLHLQNVRAGRYRLVVHPGDAALLPSEPLEVDIATSATLRVEVERARSLRVDVRTAAGEPVVGSKVELFRQEGEAVPAPGRIGGVRLVYQTFSPPGGGLVLSSAPTDAAGRACLSAPTRGRLGLRVRGAHVPVLQPLPASVDGGAIVVTVERGGTLVGALTPARLLRELVPPLDHQVRHLAEESGASDRLWPSLQLRSRASSRVVLPAERVVMGQPGFEVGDDGTFEIVGIPAGDWRIELQFAVAGAPYTHELGVATALADGERREMQFDIAALAPAELRATIRLDGELVANAEGRWGNKNFRTDARGRVVLRSPGRSYRLAVSRNDRPIAGAEMVHGDEPFPLAPGASVEHTFELTHRRLRLHVLRADGTPAASEVFGVTGFGTDFRADADGVVVLDPAPPWEFRLHTSTEAAVRGGERSVARSDPVRMPLDRKFVTLEVRLRQ